MRRALRIPERRMKENKIIKEYPGTEISSANLLTKHYSKPEDILTKSLLHIIDAGGFGLLSRLGTEFDIPIPEKIIHTTSQIPFHKESDNLIYGSRPDGLISSVPFSIMIESKLYENSINLNQLEAHIESLDRNLTYGESVLLYITPDKNLPELLNRREEGIFWIQWSALKHFLHSYCHLRTHLLYLYEAFEGLYNSVFVKENIIPSDKLTVVLAGRFAEGQALKNGIYNCQIGRTFKNAKYMTFYCNKMISYVFEIKKGPYVDPDGSYPGNYLYDLELVPDVIDKPINNNKKDKKGNPTPYTMGSPRYVSIDKLKTAKFTSEL
ncbi:MAG: hypothetical protein K2K25_01325 [Muribaculaceae bacterium]|nr:hypothetical protein [Muribaculaceae bacterium]